MVVNKRKKVGKYRGHTTHGGGHRKKRRGAGSRGGRGNAGTGKRAGHKKAGRKIEMGQHGFVRRRTAKHVKCINVGELTSAFTERLLAAGKIDKKSNMLHIDLGKLGYDKLLGTGTIGLKLRIEVEQCSAKAAEKVKAAGGEVITSERTETEETAAEKEEDGKAQ